MSDVAIGIMFVVVSAVISSITSKLKNKHKSTRINGPSQHPVQQPKPKHASGTGPTIFQMIADWQKSVYQADKDSRYDQESLDYCDSNIPATGGITFRNLPNGTDELEYLSRFNRIREHLLENALENTETNNS